jgi:hypothetical protein
MYRGNDKSKQERSVSLPGVLILVLKPPLMGSFTNQPGTS